MTEKRKKDIRLVVSDIDGTLIRRGEGFPKEVEQAAAELKKRGILFTFASGRLPYMITPLQSHLESKSPYAPAMARFFTGRMRYWKNIPFAF